MASPFQFAQSLPFIPLEAEQILRQIPTQPGVFALRGPNPADQPYLTRAADLRRRLTRLLAPPDNQTKRLNLRDRVHQIDFTITGSDFESTLLLYDALSHDFGHPEARRRMKLHTPHFVRFTADHSHPRLYTTNRLSRRTLATTYGPFQSRAAADRYVDALLDLFKLRRCYEDLEVHPDHPGCAYGEMKKCLAPCNQTCTPESYAAESTSVRSFLDTQGESLLTTISRAREQASIDMEFEAAATLHTQHTRVKASAALADPLIRPLELLRAVIILPAPKSSNTDHHNPDQASPDQANVFLLEHGCLQGPARLSTLGVRAVKEQTSVGSSLFAQPLMLQAVPLATEPGAPGLASETWVSGPLQDSPEQRAEHLLSTLSTHASPDQDLLRLSDHLSLLRRWYYRPEKQRHGELFLPNPDGTWPIRRILRAAARQVLGDPKLMAETNREAAPKAAEAIKTRLIHEGREGVEREVPILPTKRPRRQRSAP